MDSLNFSDAIKAVSDLPKPIIDEVTDLMHKLLGAPARVAGELIADELYGWKVLNRVRWIEKLAIRLKGRGIDAKALPKGFLIPVVEAVSNVEDEDLQDLWARLTANAIEDESAQHPAFIDALKQLNGEDARYFERAVANHRPILPSMVRSPSAFRSRGVSDSVPRLIRAGLLEPLLAAASKEIASSMPVATLSGGRVRVATTSSRGVAVRSAGTRVSAFGFQFHRAVAAEKPTAEPRAEEADEAPASS